MSLLKRDLPFYYGYDDNTALKIVMCLTFIAAENVATYGTLVDLHTVVAMGIGGAFCISMQITMTMTET